jgi:hypothetical protein
MRDIIDLPFNKDNMTARDLKAAAESLESILDAFHNRKDLEDEDGTYTAAEQIYDLIDMVAQNYKSRNFDATTPLVRRKTLRELRERAGRGDN